MGLFIYTHFFISKWPINTWHSIKALMYFNKITKAFMCLQIWPKPLCAYNVLKLKNN